MMKLEKPIIIDDRVKLSLTKLKGHLLMNESGKLLIIGNYIIDAKNEIKKGGFFSKDKRIKQYYLTHIDLFSWHNDLKFWGTHNQEAIEHYLTWFDLNKMRNRFIDNIRFPLEALGIDFDNTPNIKLDDINSLIRKNDEVST